jgi:hypothetical protein
MLQLTVQPLRAQIASRVIARRCAAAAQARGCASVRHASAGRARVRGSRLRLSAVAPGGEDDETWRRVQQEKARVAARGGRLLRRRVHCTCAPSAGAYRAHASQEQRIDDEIESVKALSAQQFAALTEAKARGWCALPLARRRRRAAA